MPSLLRGYFEYIYNPIYDLLISQFAPYHRLQQTCIDKLSLGNGVKLLCAGIGTGNEAIRILEANPDIQIIGIDASLTALKKAKRKAKKQGKSIETHLMDVQSLEFDERSFDQAICVHVTDFVKDPFKVSSEIIRVLKPGGKFAITFPSRKEDFHFAMPMISDAIKHDISNKEYYKIPAILASALIGAIVYFPFLFRSERIYHSKDELEKLFAKLTPGKYKIEEFPAYCDFIIYGTKSED